MFLVTSYNYRLKFNESIHVEISHTPHNNIFNYIDLTFKIHYLIFVFILFIVSKLNESIKDVEIS